jgi:RHS repeat-associated protein
VNGQVRRDATPPATKTVGYDLAGRLTSVVDAVGAVSYGGPRICTTRTYTYDTETNRTALTSYPDAGGQPDTGNCSTATTPAVYSHTYDQADRQTDTGYTYDLYGRTTAAPATDLGGTAQTIGYYANDLVASQTSGATTRTYALDPTRRLRSWTEGSNTSTNHYGSASGDSPAWISLPASTWSRNITGISGDLAAIQDNTGTVTLQLTNLHGDTVATLDDTTTATSIASYTESTEFGTPYFPSTAYTRYGWLGAKQRSHDTPGGLTLMGVRLYNPNTGRFLQTDPIPGGSANPYDYANQDPYNNVDLDGRFWHQIRHFVATHKLDIALTVASVVVPGTAGAVWAYRAYRIVRAAKAAEGMAGGIRATRATTWLAGRIWTGAGSRTTSIGGRMSQNGLRQWRPMSFKPKLGIHQSNFESRPAPKGPWTNNYHVERRGF